jgi:hypothetical protein
MNPEALFPVPLPAAPPLGINDQLEELASVAIASAQQAEAAFQRAQEAIRRTARRSMAIFAGIGLIGILVGVAGFADNYLRRGGATAQSEIAGGGAGRVAVAPISRTAKPDTDANPAQESKRAQSPTIETDGMEGPAASADTAAATVKPPVYRGPVAHAVPWQAHPPPVRRVGTGASRPGPAQVMSAFRRDLRALFRRIAS